MKYQLQPRQAILSKEGIATHEGWALIYNIDSRTGEYKNTTYEYLPVGVSLPAYAYLDSPEFVDDTKAIVRGDSSWLYLPDHRGKTVYSTTTGAEATINEIGDIPDTYTLLAPTNQFDSWNGSEWQHDAQKQHKYDVEQATQAKTENLSIASAEIQNLQDRIDGEIATENDKTQMTAWKKYRALLNTINLNNAPNIDWPVKPE